MGNGQVERLNRTIEAVLSKVVKESQRDWDRHLQKALLAYRTAIHETTGFSPYHLNFGCSPTLPMDIVLGNISEEYSSYPVLVPEVHAQLHSAHNTIKKRVQVLINTKRSAMIEMLQERS